MSFCILLGAPIQISEPARWLVCPPKAAADRLCNGRGGAGRVRARLTWALDAGIFALVVCCELSCLQDRGPNIPGAAAGHGCPHSCIVGETGRKKTQGASSVQASSGQSLLLMLQKSAVSEKAIPLFYPVARPRRWTGAGGRPTNKSPAAPGMGNCTGASAEVSFLSGPSPRRPTCPSPRSRFT